MEWVHSEYTSRIHFKNHIHKSFLASYVHVKSVKCFFLLLLLLLLFIWTKYRSHIMITCLYHNMEKTYTQLPFCLVHIRATYVLFILFIYNPWIHQQQKLRWAVGCFLLYNYDAFHCSIGASRKTACRGHTWLSNYLRHHIMQWLFYVIT